MDVPRIISVDDHIVEPPDLWQRWLPARFRDEGPRVVRAKGRIAGRGGWEETEEGGWADLWRYQGFEMAIIPGFAAAGKDQNWLGAHWDPMIYDDMLPGCYQQWVRGSPIWTATTPRPRCRSRRFPGSAVRRSRVRVT